MLADLHHHLEQTELLPVGSRLVVAVSGGLDSAVLLDLLSKLAPQWQWEIAVAHLDHQVSEGTSPNAKLAGQLAERYGYQFFLNQLLGEDSSEAAVRRARYHFLESVRDGWGGDYIVTAHNADDRLESSIFNTIRGADRYGLTTMKPRQGLVVRPLLPFKKGQLVAYAAANDLPYVADQVPTEVGYSRNYIREQVLPQISVLDPNFATDHLERLSQLESLTERIDWALSQVLEQVTEAIDDDRIVISRQGFLQLSPLVQTNLLGYMVRRLTGGVSLSRANLSRGLNYLRTGKTGSFSNALPHLIITRNYDSFEVALADSFTVPAVSTAQLLPGSSTEAGGYRIRLSPFPKPINTLNYLVKPSTLYIRGWQAGDRMAPIGMTGTKKVQDIFVDHKIPRRERLTWPLIVTPQNQPVWLVGLTFDRNWLAAPTEPHYQLSAKEL